MNKIRECREAKGLSQKYVAISLGVSAPMVSQWETGKKSPTPDKIVKLAELFGVTTDYLLNHQAEENAANLTAQEQQLIMVFRQLNESGRNVLLKNAVALLEESGYRKKESAKSGK